MINIAELLKGAPKGMKLYSPLFGEVEFKYINDSEFGIVVKDSEECTKSFNKYGRYFTSYNNAECLLFPSKDCRTWEGWKVPVEPKFKVGDWLYNNTCGIHPILVKGYSERQGYKVECIETYYYLPKGVVENEYHLWTIQDAKQGDVLANDHHILILKELDYDWYSNGFPYSVHAYCGIKPNGNFELAKDNWCFCGTLHMHPATKEQRDLLFAKMQESGYQWDAENKELRKIQPHYDIKNFHAGMPVLVRETSLNAWQYALFSHCYIGSCGLTRFVASLVGFTQCIPFNDDTKHLLGTTDMCDECYINW